MKVKIFLGLLPIIIFFNVCGLSIAVQSNTIPSFKDYIAEDIYAKKPAPVNLQSNPSAKRFRTALRTGAQKGPNFAGHYTVVSWGCGTECQTTAIIDAKNGNVYFAPFITSASCDYRKNSHLLIANPPEKIKEVYGDKIPEWLSSDYYLWKDNKFYLIYSSKTKTVN
jgi:hypothetical protein